MPDTATILHRELMDDDAGGKRADYPDIGATTICRFTTMSAASRMRDQATAGRIQSNEGYFLSVPVGTNLQETDRVVVNGITYDVTSSEPDHSHQVVRKFVLKKVG